MLDKLQSPIRINLIYTRLYILRLKSPNITFKICIAILVVETLMLGLMGAYYVDRFGQEIETSVDEKMSLPARLMSQRALTFDSVNDHSILEDLISEDVEDAFITRKNGDIFYSSDTERIGHSFLEYLDREEENFLSKDFSANRFASYTDSAGNNYKTVFSPIIINGQTLGILYIKIRSENIKKRKENIMYLFLAGALLTIFLTTLLEAYLVRTIFIPRLKSMLSVAKKVENSDFSARILVKGPRDELGKLIGQVNSMIGKIEYNINSLHLLHRSGEYLSEAENKTDFINAAITIFSQYLMITFSEDERRELVEKFKVLNFLPDEKYKVAKIFTKYGLDTTDSNADRLFSALYEKITNAMERQKNILALREAEENYRNLFSSAVEGIFRVDVSGKALEVNPSLAAMLGYDSQENMLKNCKNVIEHYRNSDDRKRFLDLLTQEGQVNDFVVQLVSKNGVSFFASLTAHAIKDSQGKLIGSEGRILDVSERIKRQQAEVEKEKALAAEKAAELASKAKSEFLANMSHDLRTPLNAILGFTQILERDHKNSINYEPLKIIRRSGIHLLSLINQILDISKIEAGRMTLEKNNFNFFQLVEDLENMMSLKALDKEIALTIDKSPDVPHYICTDEVKLRQILINLLDNAIKFTNEGGVTLHISSSDMNIPDTASHEEMSQPVPSLNDMRSLHFEITDTGVGIAQENLDQIFEAFERLKNGKVVREGTGLGLTISNNFVALLGGELDLKSTVGKGSTFSFHIPVLTVTESEIPEKAHPTRIVGLQSAHSDYRMLVVDDHVDNRKLLVTLLKPLKIELREATNGQEALDILENWRPHLIWMDLRMPVMDGFEAVKKIRESGSQVNQPVIIAVTAHVLQQSQQKIFSLGFDDIVIKPFKEDDIFNMLEKHLDIKLVYSDREKPAESINLKSKKQNLSPTAFKALPKEIVLNLQKSVNTLNIVATLEIVDEIKVQNEDLAETLSGLIRDYRFDIIQEMLGKRE